MVDIAHAHTRPVHDLAHLYCYSESDEEAAALPPLPVC